MNSFSIACAFFQVTAPNLIQEIAHPRFRAVVSATYLTTYYVGGIVVGWLGLGMELWGTAAGWRLLTCLQCLAVIPLAFWTLTPWMAESPRYLIKKGKKEQALRILANYHANGDEQDELVQNEFREIVIGVEMDEEASSRSSYKNFFKTKGNKKRFWLIVWFSWAQSMSGVSRYPKHVTSRALTVRCQNNLFAYYLPQM